MVQVFYLHVTKKAYGRHLSEHGNERWVLWRTRNFFTFWLPKR